MLTADKWRFLIAAAILLVFLITAAFLNLGRTSNLHAHDLLLSSGLVGASPASTPLLVSVPKEDANRNTLLKIFQNLDSLGAERLFILPELSEQMASKAMLVLFESTTFSSRLQLTHFQGTANSKLAVVDQTTGIGKAVSLPVPVFDSGFFRYIGLAQPDSERHPFAAASMAGRPDLTQGINFLYQQNGQPEVSAEQVATGQLIPDLVEGTHVLIELAAAGSGPGYAVPGANTALDSLHLQGLIWSTINNDAPVTPLPAWLSLLLVALVYVLNLVVLQWLHPAQGLLFSALVAVALAVVFAIVLQAFYKIFPLTELLVTQLSSLLFVLQAHRISDDRAVSSMLAESNSKLSERLAPSSFFQSENPWAKIVVLINQQLNLSRSILLEKVPGDHRVKEIQALNCSVDSIAEMRRDYQRSPYSSAIELNSPYRMDRPYFKDSSDSEVEYLVPLQFANEVMGFWAMTVLPGDNWNQAAFESNISDFAAQIGELLFHRDQWNREHKLQNHLGARLLSLEGGSRPHRELQRSLQLIEKRLDELEDVFAGLGSAALLYDLFGQIKQTNYRLEVLAQESGFAPYSLTASELLCEVCELSLDEARRELRHVTLKQEPVFLPVKPISQQHSYMLHVRPIRRRLSSPADTRIRSEIDPFQLVGILLEFVDVSHSHELLAARDDVLTQFSNDIRTPLGRITLAANRLKKLNASEEAEAKVEVIDAAIGQAVQMVDGMARINVGDGDQYKLRSLVPINPLRLLKNTLRHASATRQEKRIEIVENLPFQVALALADSERLRELLKDLLTVLINDATPESAITVTIENQNQAGRKEVVISLENEGYGLPQKTLQGLLEQPASLLVGSDDLLEHSIGSLQNLAYWGATFEAASEVGKGFQFSIHLRAIALDEARPG